MKTQITLTVLVLIFVVCLIVRMNIRRKISANLIEDIKKYFESYNYALIICFSKSNFSPKLIFKMYYKYDYVLDIIANYLSKIGCPIENFSYQKNSISFVVKVEGKNLKMKLEFEEDPLKNNPSYEYCLRMC